MTRRRRRELRELLASAVWGVGAAVVVVLLVVEVLAGLELVR